MRKALREVADLAARDRVVFLRKQADIVGEREEAFEQRLGLFEPAAHRVSVREPETARKKDAFAGRQAVVRGRRVVSQNETVAHQRFLDGGDRAEYARIPRGQKSQLAKQQKTGVELRRVVGLHEAIALCVVAAFADLP